LVKVPLKKKEEEHVILFLQREQFALSYLNKTFKDNLELDLQVFIFLTWKSGLYKNQKYLKIIASILRIQLIWHLKLFKQKLIQKLIIKD
jgi:hypothetical protein